MKKVLFILLFAGMTLFAEQTQKRIISLAPSISEILCALELQNNIVGATDFCIDPYKQTNLKKFTVGGLMNPNFEKMIQLKPDVIFILDGKTTHTEKLRQYGLNVVVLNHQSLEGIFKSIQTIGRHCDKAQEADELYKKLNSLIVKTRKDGRTVLVTISRLSTQANIRLWVAGNDGYYNKILEICGVENVIQEEKKFSQLTPEALIRLNPDEIILLRNELSDEEKKAEIEAWKKFSSLKAIRDNKFHIITGNEVLIPGPRFPILLEKFKSTLSK